MSLVVALRKTPRPPVRIGAADYTVNGGCLLIAFDCDFVDNLSLVFIRSNRRFAAANVPAPAAWTCMLFVIFICWDSLNCHPKCHLQAPTTSSLQSTLYNGSLGSRRFPRYGIPGEGGNAFARQAAGHVNLQATELEPSDFELNHCSWGALKPKSFVSRQFSQQQPRHRRRWM
jgi:hypothetical protein